MAERRTIPKQYPRKLVRIDISHARRHFTSVSQRADVDRIQIIRCGKPILVLLNYEYYEMLLRLDARGQQGKRKPTRRSSGPSWGRNSTKRYRTMQLARREKAQELGAKPHSVGR